MSPSTKPTRNLKVNVPRHNSQRIGPLLTASVEAVAREDGIRVDVSQTALEPSSALAQAIVCVLVPSHMAPLQSLSHVLLLGKRIRVELPSNDRARRPRSPVGRRHTTVRPA